MEFRHTPLPELPDEDNPRLCNVIERNVRTLARLESEGAKKRGLQEQLADWITYFSGHMNFVYLHAVWFFVWIAINSGRVGVRAFDPYPYGLLTMVVSLEAIFLSTFVLISQNRLSEEAERRANLVMQVGLLTEHELTHALRMLDAIQDKLGIANDEDMELADLEQETRPEDVLAEIERIRLRVQKHQPLP